MNTALAGLRIRPIRTSSAPGRRRSLLASTLVEVVFATAILTIVGAGIVGSINYGMLVMRLARENARATQVILEKLESIRLYDWSEVTLNGYVPRSFTNYYDPQGASNQQGATYYGTISVLPCTNGTSYSDRMRQFMVTLQWTTAGHINHTRSLSTLVARDGMQNYVY